MNDNIDLFELITFASNYSGSKIFCKLTFNGKTVVRGYYDFNKDGFFIERFVKKNFQEGMTKNIIKEHLKRVLLEEHDWELA